MLPWGESTTLSEELIRESAHGGVPRLLLAVQGIVRSVNQLVRAVPQPTHAQTQANQAWLAGLARSGEVGLLVSASASSVIEVEPEVNGDFLVAFDPLTFGSGGLLASSTFGVWQKGQGDNPALLPGSLLLASGVAIYGLVTQLVVAAAGGASSYLLDQRGEFLFQGRLSCRPTSTSSVTGSCNSLPAISCLLAVEKGQTASLSPLPLLTTAAPLAFLARAAGATIAPDQVLNTTPLNLHYRLALTVGPGPASEEDHQNPEERGAG